MVPVPMGTLDDEPRAGDAMEDEQPRPRRRGWLERIVDRLTMRPR